MPDGVGDERHFELEHYRPTVQFPKLRLDFANMYWACGGCNRRKGSWWPNEADQSARRFIPNPCEHRMAEHLRFEGPRVRPRTPAGRWTEEQLDLNNEEVVSRRSTFIDSAEQFKRKARDARDRAARIDARLQTADDVEREKLLRAKVAVEASLQASQSHLANFGLADD